MSCCSNAGEHETLSFVMSLCEKLGTQWDGIMDVANAIKRSDWQQLLEMNQTSHRGAMQVEPCRHQLG
jgi:hypothetical protein